VIIEPGLSSDRSRGINYLRAARVLARDSGLEGLSRVREGALCYRKTALLLPIVSAMIHTSRLINIDHLKN
jgi:hypothetical protein